MSENEHNDCESKVASRKRSQSGIERVALKIAVLISGSGSNLQALINAIEGGQLPRVEIVLVVSNKPDAFGLQRALQNKLPALYLPWKQREEAEARLSRILQLFQVDLVVLAGWMRIFTPEFVTQFSGRMINLHPALLPDNGTSKTYVTSNGTEIPAFRGLQVVKQALDAGVKVTGSTVHYVTAEVDAGPVICREEVPIEEGDTEETLHERIKRVEHRLIVEAVRGYAQGL
jgi:phosphoribosylglycinamide formyltransferase-1